jgi:hypothetical protein
MSYQPVVAKLPPQTHHLKTNLEVFQHSWEGTKTFEVRFNDRNFQVGDLLVLRENATDEAGRHLSYTGRYIKAKISYILEAKYGIPREMAVLQLVEMENGMEGQRYEDS